MKTSRCATIAVVLLAGGVWRLNAQTTVDLTRQGKLGTGATVPSQCAVGQVFFNTGAPAGANLYSCTSVNVWSVVGLIPLGGDVSGTAPAATVTGLQGRPASAAIPLDQDALRWNAASGLWAPEAVISVGSSTPPATCSAGGLYLRNDTANNFHQLYVCSTTNVWSMASIQSGAASGRPANCLLGQTWLATDTGAMTYCAATGSPGTWSATLAGPAGPQGPAGATGATGAIGPQGPAGGLGGANGQLPYNNNGTAAGSNLSQNTDGSLSANKAFNPPLCTVTLSATPAFDASQCNAFSLTLGSTTVTGSTLLNAKAGQSLTFTIVQDATGGRSFIWPTNLLSGCPVDPAANTSTAVSAIFDGTNANAMGCTTSDLATLIAGPTRSAPGTPSTGLACWFDSSANTLLCKDPGGNVYAATKTASAATSNQYATYVDASGVQHTAVLGSAALAGLVRGGNPFAAAELSGDAATSGSNAVTVKGLNGVPFCTGLTPTTGQALEYTTASSPNPCYTAATPSSGGSVFTGSTATASTGITGTAAAPVLSLSDQSVKSPVRVEIALTASTNVTSVTINNKTAGAKFSVVWTQPSANMDSVTWGSSVSNTPCAVSQTASAWTEQLFEVASDGATVTSTGCTSSDPAVPWVNLQSTAPGTPQTGNLNISGAGIFAGALSAGSLGSPFGGLATAGYPSAGIVKSSGSALSGAVAGTDYMAALTVSARTANQFVTYIDANGVEHTAAIAAADVPTLNQSTTGNAATATALAAAPGTCSAGQGAAGINASGTAQGCTPYVQLAGDLGNTAASPQVVSTHLAAGLPRAQGGLNSTSAGSGLLRDGTTPAASELSGDCTTSGSNVVTCPKTGGNAFGSAATAQSYTVALLPSTTAGSNLFSTENLSTWSNSALTITSGISDPNSGTSAYRLTETTATNNHYVYLGATATPGATILYTVYIRPGSSPGRTTALLDIDDGTELQANYNLATATVTTADSGVTAAIVAAGNGYYKLTFQRTVPNAAISWAIISPSAVHDNSSYTGDGTSYIDVFQPTVQILSAAPATGTLALVTDGVTSQDVSIGGGAFSVWARWNGAGWVALSSQNSRISATAFSSSNTSTASPLIYVGDSLTAGLHGTYPPSYYVSPTWTFTQTNQGIVSQTLKTMESTVAANVFPLYAPSVGWNIVSVWGGVNDIVGGSTATQVFGYLVSIHRELHRAGFRTIVNTLTPCGTATCTSAQQTIISTLNGLIRAQWWQFGDALADLNATTHLTDPTNTTYYYTDQIHLIDAGYSIVGGVWQAAVNSITSGTGPIVGASGIFSGTITAGTYTVSTLPACNSGAKGTSASVTDAISPTYLGTLTGSGAVFTPVACNGTAWVSY